MNKMQTIPAKVQFRSKPHVPVMSILLEHMYRSPLGHARMLGKFKPGIIPLIVKNVFNDGPYVSFDLLSLMFLIIIIKIIYHDFLPTPRRDSHVKSDKTHTQSLRYTP